MSDSLSSFEYPAKAIFFIFAMTIIGYISYMAFDGPPTERGDGPILPRYMAQPRQYRAAAIVYVIICLVFYVYFAYFWKDLLRLAETVAPPWFQKIVGGAVQNGLLSFPVAGVSALVISCVLLKTEADWNPLVSLRRLVWNWVSIPKLADTIMLAARDALAVPTAHRANVARNPDTVDVDVDDFDKVRGTLDRDWAELCYIRLWLAAKRDEGGQYIFFNEPSFAWEKLEAEYQRIRPYIGPFKKWRMFGEQIIVDYLCTHPSDRDVWLNELTRREWKGLNPGEVHDLVNVPARVRVLRSQYCRAATCFLIHKSDSWKTVATYARYFGVPFEDKCLRSNPARYYFVFLIVLIISIYGGVYSSAAVWDSLHGNASAVLKQETDLVIRQTGYAMGNYGAPIVAIFSLSYVGWIVNHERPACYPISYAASFVVAVCASAISLASVARFISGSSYATEPFLNILLSEFKWSVSPALISVFVAYRVDQRLDPLLQDTDSFGTYLQLVRRLYVCIAIALSVTLLSLQPSLSLTAPPHSAWPVDKLRVVVIGTMFTIGLVMALLAEFCLVAPKPAPEPLHDVLSAR